MAARAEAHELIRIGRIRRFCQEILFQFGDIDDESGRGGFSGEGTASAKRPEACV